MESCSPYINSFTIIGIDAKKLMTILDLKGIKIATGSACSSGENKPSRVLKVIGLTDEEATGTIRISINENNTKDEIDLLCYLLKGDIEVLKE